MIREALKSAIVMLLWGFAIWTLLVLTGTL